MSTTPLDNASADRPARAVARILKAYGFEAHLTENPYFPRIDSIDVIFSSSQDEEVGRMSILDILNENGYQAWLNQCGSRRFFLNYIQPCDPGTADSSVHPTI